MILTLSKSYVDRVSSSGQSLQKLATLFKDFVGYGLCSAAALACDCGVLFALTRFGMNYLPSAAVGFFTGMMLAYILSIRFVYAGRREMNATWEAIGFFAIGAAGLLLNQVLLFAFVDELHFSLGLAKGFTAIGVFLFNFIARRSVLFSSKARG